MAFILKFGASKIEKLHKIYNLFIAATGFYKKDSYWLECSDNEYQIKIDVVKKVVFFVVPLQVTKHEMLALVISEFRCNAPHNPDQ